MERRPWFYGFRLVLAGLAFAAASTIALAYDEPPHRAARLSYLEGTVTIDSASNTGGYATGGYQALMNMPLAQGQRITTGVDGQAEVEFEDGSVVRVTPYSSISLDSLAVDSEGNLQTQVTIVSGLVYAELRATTKYAYRLVAGGDVISPVENVTVRVNMDQPPAVVSVFDGVAHVEGTATGYQREVRSGESLREDSSSSDGYFLTQMIVQDSWDAWNEDRDRQAAEQAASRTPARDGFAGIEGYGWSDLDANGTWYDVPDMGPVWQPSIALDDSFDPYGYGSWVSYPGVGYVWASGYPWGWTPYRCGRWSYWTGFGWGWMPAGGCGHGGWGFPGGVFLINIGHAPPGYHFHPLPGHNPSGLHPIVIVRPGHGPTIPVQQPGGTRTIAGRAATPIQPVAASYVATGGSAAGAPLQRDFPIDVASRQPITGVESTSRGEYTGNAVSRTPYHGGVSSMYAPGSMIVRPAPAYRSAPMGSYTVRPAAPPPHVSAPPHASPPPSRSSAPPSVSHTR